MLMIGIYISGAIISYLLWNKINTKNNKIKNEDDVNNADMLKVDGTTNNDNNDNNEYNNEYSSDTELIPISYLGGYDTKTKKEILRENQFVDDIARMLKQLNIDKKLR